MSAQREQPRSSYEGVSRFYARLSFTRARPFDKELDASSLDMKSTMTTLKILSDLQLDQEQC